MQVPSPTQSSRATPRALNFFAYASLRFSALAAVSMAAWASDGFIVAALYKTRLFAPFLHIAVEDKVMSKGESEQTLSHHDQGPKPVLSSKK